MSTTPKLALRYIVASQAQKEITHNEALNDLDVLVQPIVASRSLSAPPSSPSEGDAYIVGASPTGAWSGHAGEIALYFSGWRFKVPEEGWRFYVTAEDAEARFKNGAWGTVSIDAATTWAPGTLANGAGVSSSAIAVSGAAFGDFVLVCAPYDPQGVLVCGYVSSSGNVVIRVHNATGASVTLASGSWKIRIVKG